MGVAGESQPAGLGQIKVTRSEGPSQPPSGQVMKASPGNSRAFGMAEIVS